MFWVVGSVLVGFVCVSLIGLVLGLLGLFVRMSLCCFNGWWFGVCVCVGHWCCVISFCFSMVLILCFCAC